jgi:carbon-monoxide dehydrogenase large subunit
MEIPPIEIEHLETPPISPVNFRGVGEGGAICAPPAITNAISDALGVPITQLPLTPTRILELLGVIPENKGRLNE